MWFDKDKCGGCQYAGMDMDMEPYCVNHTVRIQMETMHNREFRYGVTLGSAIPICKYELRDQERPDKIEVLNVDTTPHQHTLGFM
ncbi:hypothetical protein [Pseudomonas phage Astolliot]|nr:hypothetical protein [Pseudomonas phage Astolliot]